MAVTSTNYFNTWTAPITWTSGQQVTYTQVQQQISDNIDIANRHFVSGTWSGTVSSGNAGVQRMFALSSPFNMRPLWGVMRINTRTTSTSLELLLGQADAGNPASWYAPVVGAGPVIDSTSNYVSEAPVGGVGTTYSRDKGSNFRISIYNYGTGSHSLNVSYSACFQILSTG